MTTVPLFGPFCELSKFYLKNGFEFVKEVIKQDSRLFMASLDVESLCTNIPLQDAVNIFCDTFFANEAKINNFSRSSFEKILRMALQTKFFIFDSKI